jgi:hypothetical protein
MDGTLTHIEGRPDRMIGKGNRIGDPLPPEETPNPPEDSPPTPEERPPRPEKTPAIPGGRGGTAG